MTESKKSFALSPSAIARSGLPSPTAFMPALPVRLEGVQGKPTYALVDTGAHISAIPAALAQSLGLRTAGQAVIVQGPSGPSSGARGTVDLTICDEDFEPWLRFDAVPFVFLPSVGEAEVPMLGYQSCLEWLRITLDYPRRSMMVEASSEFLIPQAATRIELPAPIREAASLVTTGSFAEGVILLAAGLDEAIFRVLPSLMHSGPSPSVRPNHLLTIGLSSEAVDAYMAVREVRNKAAHARRVSESEARRALSLTFLVLGQIDAYTNPRPAPKYGFTPRERELLVLTAEGYTSQQIAQTLSVSHATVSATMRRIREKVGTNLNMQAVLKAASEGAFRPNETVSLTP